MSAEPLDIEIYVKIRGEKSLSFDRKEWEMMTDKQKKEEILACVIDNVDVQYTIEHSPIKQRHKCTDDCSVKMPNISVGPGIMCS